MKCSDEYLILLALSLGEDIGPARLNQFLAALDYLGIDLATFVNDYARGSSLDLKPPEPVDRALGRLDRLMKEAAEVRRRVEEFGGRVVTLKENAYPSRLRRFLDQAAPPVLFCKGTVSNLKKLTIAIIGTRAASGEAMEAVAHYAGALAEEGVTIVSGHARGIDSAAHSGALSSGGRTTFVLPYGLLRFTPGGTGGKLLKRGGWLLLSQFPPTEIWRTRNAIIRNNTIIALCDGVIVGETGLKGGTSHGIRAALKMGKPIWALQYRQYRKTAEGNKSLLSCGARPLCADLTSLRSTISEIVAVAKGHRARRPRMEQGTFLQGFSGMKDWKV